MDHWTWIKRLRRYVHRNRIMVKTSDDRMEWISHIRYERSNLTSRSNYRRIHKWRKWY